MRKHAIATKDSDDGELEVSQSSTNVDHAGIAELASRLASIEHKLELLLSSKNQVQQEFYSTADVARILGKAEWTVREWCRQARVNATKRPCGRGCSKEWIISHEELERIRSEGLLPSTNYRYTGR